MDQAPIVTKIEITEFSYELQDIEPHRETRMPTYKKGGKLTRRSRVLSIETDLGITGEYVGGNASELAGVANVAYALLGRSALARERFYNDAKLSLKQQARMGMSQVDMALWDIAGKFFDAPVYQLLGEYRTELPCYASTMVGDDEPDGLSTPEAYADFAEQCLEMGYPAYKIHWWREAPMRKRLDLLKAVAERVGGKMDLMLDPASTLLTFADAVKVGRACDEYGFMWLEDPYRDGGVSAFGHRKLRELIRTPLLQTEHIRGLEMHVDFIVADGTDFVRIDPDYDGGITGGMKIAHAAEGFGLDAEIHVGGPERRNLMAAIRNSNYYELGLVHPRLKLSRPPAYLDFDEQLDSIDEHGNVSVPTGPGFGATLDWEYIRRHETGKQVFERS
ncbi:MAG: mandelate racemase [Chloroflexi bacterium]|nr:mandelate racemase [Chloroflexota bacterium]MDA1145106.1 mandelate racemase [Chloroflexota bacterium]